MGIWNVSNFEPQAEKIRAGVRVNSRLPVAVEWTEAGRTERAEGHTMDASTKGCLAVIPRGLGVGQRLRLINLANQNVCEAVVIWRGHEGRAGWELGLELQDASLEFWGLDF